MGKPTTLVVSRKGGERRELKHLSTCRKRNQPRFPQERRANGEQPNLYVVVEEYGKARDTG